MSWNVRGFSLEPLAIARVVHDVGPAVLCLQEAPRAVASRTRLEWFAHHVGMRGVAGGGHGAGVAILARPDLTVRCGASAVRLLPRWFGPVPHGPLESLAALLPGAVARHLLPQQRRGTAAVRLELEGGRYVTIASAHLSLHEWEREAHARAILTDTVRSLGPVIVCADANETREGVARTLLEESFEDALDDDCWTFPALCPRRRIDVIYRTPDIAVERAEVVRATEHVGEDVVRDASDHLPQYADLLV